MTRILIAEDEALLAAEENAPLQILSPNISEHVFGKVDPNVPIAYFVLASVKTDFGQRVAFEDLSGTVFAMACRDFTAPSAPPVNRTCEILENDESIDRGAACPNYRPRQAPSRGSFAPRPPPSTPPPVSPPEKLPPNPGHLLRPPFSLLRRPSHDGGARRTPFTSG